MVDLNDAARATQSFAAIAAALSAERERILLRELRNSERLANHYRRLETEAAVHVESPIVLRTNFTGSPPYVGWKGVGLALNDALDELDSLRLAASVVDGDFEAVTESLAKNIAGTIDRRHDITEGVSRDLIEIVTAALRPVLRASRGSAT